MAQRKINTQELIEKSSELFRTRGYHCTSISDIAQVCGLSKASVYHHITSKLELAIATLSFEHQFFKTHMFALTKSGDSSAAEKLDAFVDRIYEHYSNRVGGCLMGNMALEITDTVPELQTSVQAFFNEWCQVFARLFESAFPAQVAQEKAELSISTLEGAILMSRVTGTPKPLQRACRQVKSFLNVETSHTVPNAQEAT